MNNYHIIHGNWYTGSAEWIGPNRSVCDLFHWIKTFEINPKKKEVYLFDLGLFYWKCAFCLRGIAFLVLCVMYPWGIQTVGHAMACCHHKWQRSHAIISNVVDV